MAKILVIEDETSLREDIAELLTLEGYSVISACDGVEGVNSAISQQPDLIICDIMMPRLDGYEVLLDVRANSLTQFVPFIFLTAKAARDDMRTGMELGADDYVTKPFARLDLLRAIEKRLDVKAAQEREHQEQIDQFKAVLAHERGQRLLTERLISIFSSDFRNPVEGILTSTQLLTMYGEQVDESRRAAHLSRIEMAARYLLQMLDDMLVVAQIENDSLRFAPESLEIGQFVAQVVDEFRLIYADVHPLEYRCNVTRPMQADPRLMRQIAVNLIRHAARVTRPSGTIFVTLEELAGEYVLTVQHAGDDVPAGEAQPSLAGEFSFSNGDGGLETGLGLTVVNQAVDLHGGFLQIEQQPSTGTKTTVVFPIR
ncbi:MAG: response regulator [Anaerolineae bacterium]